MPVSRPLRRNGRVLPVALVCVTLGIGACGSSDGPTRAAGNGLLFSDCMRAHGVPDFPDALAGGGYDLPPTVDQQAPAYMAAEKRCASLEPGPVPPHEPTEHQSQLDIAFSRCVRAHGLPSFPDPARDIPPPGAAHGFIRGGYFWAVGAGTVSSPAFRQAASSCGWHVTAAVSSGGGEQ